MLGKHGSLQMGKRKVRMLHGLVINHVSRVRRFLRGFAGRDVRIRFMVGDLELNLAGDAIANRWYLIDPE